MDSQIFKRGNVVQLQIEAMAFNGRGIAKVATPAGNLVVFVPNTIPGQEVKAKIVKKKTNHVETKLIEVIKRSDSEVNIPYQAIPGAPYARLPIELQKEFKTNNVIELFKRIGGVSAIELLVDEYIESPNIWHYRNKMEYGFSHHIWNEELQDEEKSFGLGFKRRGSFWIIENLDGDSGLFDKEFEDKLKEIRNFCKNSGLQAWNYFEKKGFFRFFVVRKSYYQNKLLFNLVTTSNGLEKFDMQAFSDFMEGLLGERFAGLIHTINDEIGDRSQPHNGSYKHISKASVLEERINGLNFDISMQSFFQTNPKCAELLYQKTIDYTLEKKPEKGEVIMDLFCGTGTIGQLIASATDAKIVGIDIIKEAIENAKANAKKNKIENTQFYAEDVGKFLRYHPEYQGQIKTLVLDPPRAGIAPKTLQKIIALEAQRIVYVSCNPATQARDTATLIENDYQLKKISLVNQFPHTAHIESIALFEK